MSSLKDLHKMRKEELVVKCQRLQSEKEQLRDELDRLSDCYTELENECADLTDAYNERDIIEDVSYFRLRLEMDHLMTPELEDFIEDYMKFHNEKG